MTIREITDYLLDTMSNTTLFEMAFKRKVAKVNLYLLKEILEKTLHNISYDLSNDKFKRIGNYLDLTQ